MPLLIFIYFRYSLHTSTLENASALQSTFQMQPPLTFSLQASTLTYFTFFFFISVWPYNNIIDEEWAFVDSPSQKVVTFFDALSQIVIHILTSHSPCSGCCIQRTPENAVWKLSYRLFIVDPEMFLSSHPVSDFSRVWTQPRLCHQVHLSLQPRSFISVLDQWVSLFPRHSLFNITITL